MSALADEIFAQLKDVREINIVEKGTNPLMNISAKYATAVLKLKGSIQRSLEVQKALKPIIQQEIALEVNLANAVGTVACNKYIQDRYDKLQARRAQYQAQMLTMGIDVTQGPQVPQDPTLFTQHMENDPLAITEDTNEQT